MSFDRVIQDSDDEEDLGELSPERTNRVAVPDNEVQLQNELENVEPQESAGDSHIGVNFDAFLNSPEAPHRTLSASQQQREERWIPAEGNTMTEIGLAQQRLFDDDHQAQHAHQQMASHEPEQMQNPEYDVTTADASIDPNGLPTAPDQDTLLTNHTHPHLEPPATNPSFEWSQTASYNIFDSSSHPASAVTPLNRADFIRDSTGLTDPISNFESRRWNYLQMQGVVSSPHDTEPFSSIISPPKIPRIDNEEIAQNVPQASSASVDELALPVVSEMPKVEKRGRPKKQPVPVPVDDEDDELAHPHFEEPPAAKADKRKPGRPPKTAKVPVEETVNVKPVEEPEKIAPPQDEDQETTVFNEQALSDGTTANDVSPHNDVEEPTEDIQVPTKPKKEPKKKKLKRSKTHDSDAEDDVIVINEQPISDPSEPSTDTVAEQAPAPKKRGRKKKKRTEEPEPAPQPENEPGAQPAVSTEENHEPGISVVLPPKPSTTRTQTPDIDTPDPINEGQPQEPQEPQNPTSPSPNTEAPETPQKRTDPKTPSSKGPGKHSPISSTSKVPYRVGLSKRARIAPLLKIIKR
ncbi:uncharacterized protein BDV14DRAFT_203472 [Aspergillus stella-maris]|uniref:uncharacterized protein n=1 Tax=Aspergillus stella-maris TaxID=1810926 RepID=UPI003CCD2035